MLKQLFDFFKVFRHLSIPDLLKLKSVSKSGTFKEGEMIAQQRERYPYVIAIKKGVIRTYELKTNGEERTTKLAKDGEFTACSACLYKNEPSFEFLQATEDCKVLLISIPKFMEYARDNPRLQKAFDMGTTQALLDAIERIRFFTLLTPEERYMKLMEESPDLIQRVPQKYLASYLGVTTVSLSRIRSRLSEMKM